MSPLAISLRFLQTQPDSRLVELARAGHERAFEALVRRYRGPLLAYCRRVAPRGTAPEDILQQGLLQAWKALSSGNDVRDARAWLYRIVHNVAISALRASGELPDTVVSDAGSLGVEQLVEQRMAAREALAGLAALPDLQRQVMVSTALDGASHEEIAAALGLSSGSVRGLIYRARSTLRAAAAAVIPAPVIDWALRDGGSGAAGGLAGGGAAGVGALMFKGGAILAVGAVGAIAGTAAIVAGHHSGHPNGVHHRTLLLAGHDQAYRQAAEAVAQADGTRSAAGTPASRTELLSLLNSSFADRSGSRHDGSGGGDGSGRGSNGGGDGSSGGGSSSGSDGGGDHGTTTTSGGADGGGQGATTATSGTDGGGQTTTTSSGTSDGGGSTTTTTDGGSSSGSSGSGSDGGSSDGGSDGGGSTTTATTTTTTTTTSAH